MQSKNTAALEKHYTPGELAKLWHCSPNTVRGLCAGAGGIFVLDRPERMNKRGYRTIRIPESTAVRVYERYFESQAA